VPAAGQILLALSIVFLAAVVRDSLKTGGALTPKRAAWLRIAILFAAIPAALSLLRAVFG